MKISFTSVGLLSSIIVMAFFAFLIVPDVTMAQTAPGGVVTCNGTDCSACNLVQMINTIIGYLFGAVGLIFAVIMMKAGFGLVTSGGNTAALSAAKSHFQNALIGLLIVMAAWLVVDIIMRSLMKGGTGDIEGWGPWSEVRCQDQTDTIAFVDVNTGNGGTPTVTGQGQVASSTASSSCSVPPLSVMTDTLALSMEQGNSLVYNNPNLQRCAERFAAQVGGRVTSAYRPPQYQTHLYEIRDRWCTQGLRANTAASCATLKTAIGSEVTKHFNSNWQCGAVGRTSLHTANSAVDISGIANHSAPNVQAAATANCLVWRNYPNDAVHYDLQPNCTCN